MLWREAQIQFFTHGSSLLEFLQCFLSSLSMDRWHARRTPPALAKQTDFITFHCLETQYQAIKFWFLRSSSSENELWCSGRAFYPKVLLAIKSLFCNSWKKREDEGEGKRRRRAGRVGVSRKLPLLSWAGPFLHRGACYRRHSCPCNLAFPFSSPPPLLQPRQSSSLEIISCCSSRKTEQDRGKLYPLF